MNPAMIDSLGHNNYTQSYLCYMIDLYVLIHQCLNHLGRLQASQRFMIAKSQHIILSILLSKPEPNVMCNRLPTGILQQSCHPPSAFHHR
jgi:hypothetical protein